MDVHLTPETESRLNELSHQSGRGTDELLQEVVENLLEHKDWFSRQVHQGLESARSGRLVEDDQVRKWVETLEERAANADQVDRGSRR